MTEELIYIVVNSLKNSMNEYSDYIASYDVPSKVVLNYLVCESIRKHLNEQYNIQTGMKRKVNAYNRYIDVLIKDKMKTDTGYIFISLKKNDDEKVMNTISYLTNNSDALGLILDFSSVSSSEIFYKAYYKGMLTKQNKIFL